MSTVARPRGPLPARVYWTRRVLVLVVAFALVWGLAHLLGGGSDGRSDGGGATLSGSNITQPPATQRAGPTGRATPKNTAKPKPTTTPLAQPDGPCQASEVRVVPKVAGAVAGRGVRLALQLTSTESDACTWRVAPNTMAVKLTSGKDFIWSTQDCPRSITTQDVIVRKTQPVMIEVAWSGRRSDGSCSRTTATAMPGYYHVLAAALGGTPTDQQFELNYPTRPTITVTVQPTKQSAAQQSGPTGATEPSNPR